MGVAILVERALPGAKASLRGHIERAGRIVRAIETRFGIWEPHQWRAKHLRWALERWSINLLPSSRYDYWRQAMDEVVAWILWYNRTRLHTTLASVSPLRFEGNWLANQPWQASE